jgi:hypothetical protein
MEGMRHASLGEMLKRTMDDDFRAPKARQMLAPQLPFLETIIVLSRSIDVRSYAPSGPRCPCAPMRTPKSFRPEEGTPPPGPCSYLHRVFRTIDAGHYTTPRAPHLRV